MPFYNPRMTLIVSIVVLSFVTATIAAKLKSEQRPPPHNRARMAGIRSILEEMEGFVASKEDPTGSSDIKLTTVQFARRDYNSWSDGAKKGARGDELLRLVIDLVINRVIYFRRKYKKQIVKNKQLMIKDIEK